MKFGILASTIPVAATIANCAAVAQPEPGSGVGARVGGVNAVLGLINNLFAFNNNMHHLSSTSSARVTASPTVVVVIQTGGSTTATLDSRAVQKQVLGNTGAGHVAQTAAPQVVRG